MIVYYGAKDGVPKRHDLSYLMNQIKDQETIEDKYYDYAHTLSPYGVSVRYPNELYLEEKHAKEAVRFADEILQWVKDIVDVVE